MNQASLRKLVVESTTRCNMRCAMCVKYSAGSSIGDADLPFALFERIAPGLKECDTLILNGIGEPLLHPDIAAMVALAREHMAADAMIGFQSNGLLLTPGLAWEISEAGLDTLCLSVDSVDEGRGGSVQVHGAGQLGRVEKAMRLMLEATRDRERPFRVGVEFVAMRENLGELPDVVRWAGLHGASYVLATHVLPYSRDTEQSGLFDPNTDQARAIFSQLKAEAEAEGLDVGNYFGNLWKFNKTTADRRLCELVARTQDRALEKGVWVHIKRLLQWDGEGGELADTFGEAERVARECGVELKLPEPNARDERRCDFVEDGVAFVDVHGNVAPCHFLWHGYACHMDGKVKTVRPVFFGNLAEQELAGIWNGAAYEAFREEVLRYEYPYCANCSFVPCQDITGDSLPFEMDCLGVTVPCGHCLWCMGGLNCLI